MGWASGACPRWYPWVASSAVATRSRSEAVRIRLSRCLRFPETSPRAGSVCSSRTFRSEASGVGVSRTDEAFLGEPGLGRFLRGFSVHIDLGVELAQRFVSKGLGHLAQDIADGGILPENLAS